MEEMKICTKCGPPAQPIENFAFRSLKRGTRLAICKSCQNTYVRAHYQRNRSKYIQKARTRNKEQVKINYEYIVAYLRDHACADCGESDIIVLEFDHQRDKLADVSVLARDGYSLDKIKREIDKCEVVCANCHRRRTAKQFGTYRYRLG